MDSNSLFPCDPRDWSSCLPLRRNGDPFDILVLGPALPGGTMVRGISVGVMFNEKGLDSKVVVSPLDTPAMCRSS